MEITPEQWKVAVVEIHQSSSSAYKKGTKWNIYTFSNANTHAQITENAIAADTNTNCTTKHNHIVMINLLDLKRNFVRENIQIY